MSTLLERPPAAANRAGSQWDYVSASRLNLWLRCPLAFKFRYVDGITTPTTPSLFVGKRVHDALECFYRHRQLGTHLPSEQVGQRITETWDEAVAAEGMKFDSASDEATARQQVIRLVDAYLQQLPADEPLPLAVETSLEAALVDPVTGEDLGISLVGILDLVLDGREGPVICDFKTAGNSTPPLAVTHEIQLTCYSYLLHSRHGAAGSGSGNPQPDQDQDAADRLSRLRGPEAAAFSPAFCRDPGLSR